MLRMLVEKCGQVCAAGIIIVVCAMGGLLLTLLLHFLRGSELSLLSIVYPSVAAGVLMLALPVVLLVKTVVQRAEIERTLQAREQQLALHGRELLKAHEKIMQAERVAAVSTLASGMAQNFDDILSQMQQFIESETADLHTAEYDGIQTLLTSGFQLTRRLRALTHHEQYALAVVDPKQVLDSALEPFACTHPQLVIKKQYAAQGMLVNVDAERIEQLLFTVLQHACAGLGADSAVTVGIESLVVGAAEDHAVISQAGEYVRLFVHSACQQEDAANESGLSGLLQDSGATPSLSTEFAETILQPHAGFFHTAPAEQGGHVYCVYLPIHDRQSSLKPIAKENVPTGLGTILLVDDEAPVRKVAQNVLSRLGYTVLTAANGRKAIHIFRDHKDEIDLVILDMVMPQLSGLETYGRLRAMKPSVRVLIASGYSSPEQTRHLWQQENCDFIQKPFRIEQIADKIHALLNDA